MENRVLARFSYRQSEIVHVRKQISTYRKRGNSNMFRFLAAALIAGVMTFPAEGIAQPSQTGSESRVRTYYVAADEVEWDYTPSGMDKMMGMKFEGWGEMFTKSGPHAIGRIYRKAVYREYTDASFSKLKPRSPEWEHLGILGPVLRVEDSQVLPFGRTRFELGKTGIS